MSMSSKPISSPSWLLGAGRDVLGLVLVLVAAVRRQYATVDAAPTTAAKLFGELQNQCWCLRVLSVAGIADEPNERVVGSRGATAGLKVRYPVGANRGER